MPIFAPENYGTVTGTNAANDMALIQQAIDAASAAGGTVLLAGTYAYGARAGTQTIGANRNIGYSLRVDAGVSNVTITGGGTLKLTEMPSLAGVHSYVGLIIGWGWNIDIDGPWVGTGPDFLASLYAANNRYCTNITVENLHFDNSLLTDSQLQILSQGVISSVITLAGCQNSTVDNIRVNRAWGVTGAISTNTWTHDSVIKNCRVGKSYNVGFWFDGAWDCTFDGLQCLNFAGPTPTGAILAANTDNRRVSERSTLSNFQFANVHVGVAVNGSNNLVKNGSIQLLGDDVTHFGYVVEPVSTSRGNWEAIGNQFLNTTVDRPGSSSSAKGVGFYLKGQLNAYGPGALRTMNTLITGNTVGSQTHTMSYAIQFDIQAVNNSFTKNIYYCTLLAQQGGATAPDNVITQNTQR